MLTDNCYTTSATSIPEKRGIELNIIISLVRNYFPSYANLNIWSILQCHALNFSQSIEQKAVNSQGVLVNACVLSVLYFKRVEYPVRNVTGKNLRKNEVFHCRNVPLKRSIKTTSHKWIDFRENFPRLKILVKRVNKCNHIYSIHIFLLDMKKFLDTRNKISRYLSKRCQYWERKFCDTTIQRNKRANNAKQNSVVFVRYSIYSDLVICPFIQYWISRTYCTCKVCFKRIAKNFIFLAFINLHINPINKTSNH